MVITFNINFKETTNMLRFQQNSKNSNYKFDFDFMQGRITVSDVEENADINKIYKLIEEDFMIKEVFINLSSHESNQNAAEDTAEHESVEPTPMEVALQNAKEILQKGGPIVVAVVKEKTAEVREMAGAAAEAAKAVHDKNKKS